MPRVILPQFPKAHPADLAGKTEDVIDFLERGEMRDHIATGTKRKSRDLTLTRSSLFEPTKSENAWSGPYAGDEVRSWETLDPYARARASKKCKVNLSISDAAVAVHSRSLDFLFPKSMELELRLE